MLSLQPARTTHLSFSFTKMAPPGRVSHDSEERKTAFLLHVLSQRRKRRKMQEGILTFITARGRRVISACLLALAVILNMINNLNQIQIKEREKAKILSKTFQEQRLMGKRMSHLFQFKVQGDIFCIKRYLFVHLKQN